MVFHLFSSLQYFPDLLLLCNSESLLLSHQLSNTDRIPELTQYHWSSCPLRFSWVIFVPLSNFGHIFWPFTKIMCFSKFSQYQTIHVSSSKEQNSFCKNSFYEEIESWYLLPNLLLFSKTTSHKIRYRPYAITVVEIGHGNFMVPQPCYFSRRLLKCLEEHRYYSPIGDIHRNNCWSLFIRWFGSLGIAN